MSTMSSELQRCYFASKVEVVHYGHLIRMPPWTLPCGGVRGTSNWEGTPGQTKDTSAWEGLRIPQVPERVDGEKYI